MSNGTEYVSVFIIFMAVFVMILVAILGGFLLAGLS